MSKILSKKGLIIALAVVLLGAVIVATQVRSTSAQVAAEKGISLNLSESVVEKFLGKLLGVEDEAMTLGAAAGPEHTEHQYFKAGLTFGGRVATSTTGLGGEATSTTADFFGLPSVIDWDPNNDVIFAISATSMHGYVPEVGDVAQVFLYNNNPNSGVTVILTDGGEGDITVQSSDSTGSNATINGMNFARLTIVREDVFKVAVLVEEFLES